MNNLLQTRRQQTWLLVLLLILPQALSFAAPAPQGKLTGEAWVTGAATVNSKAAVSGMTILNGSRIETGPDGLMSVNLGNLGRVAVQTETEFLLSFRENGISGELTTGTIVVNIPRGVAVNVKTPYGEAMVPVDQTPAIMTVGVSGDGTHVFIKRDQDRPRAFRPFEPAKKPLAGWVLPFLGATAVGAISAFATLIPNPPDVTTIVPGLIFLVL